jgi:uncharacterized protein
MQKLLLLFLISLMACSPSPKKTTSKPRVVSAEKPKSKIAIPYLRKGYHTCLKGDLALKKAPLAIKKFNPMTIHETLYINMLFRKGERKSKSGDRVVFHMINQAQDARTGFFYAQNRQEMDNLIGAVTLTNWVLCRAPQVKNAWLQKLTYEATIIKNKGMNMINMGPNFMAFGSDWRNAKMMKYFKSFPNSYPLIAKYLIQNFPNDLKILKALASNLQSLKLTVQLQKVFILLDRISAPNISQLLKRAQYLLKSNKIQEAKEIVSKLGKTAEHHWDFHNIKATFYKKEGKIEKAKTSALMATYYGQFVSGFTLPYSKENSTLLTQLLTDDKVWKKAMTTLKLRPKGEQAALLAATLSECHNCTRNTKEASKCRITAKALFSLGPQYHTAFENILATGVTCVGTRTILAELLVQRLYLVLSKTIVAKLLNMEYSHRIFEKIFFQQSLLEAGHGKFLHEMLNKLLSQELETLTALVSLRSVARFMGKYGQSILDKYLSIPKKESKNSLNAGAALCAYGVTHDKKYLGKLEKYLENISNKLPLQHLCYIHPKDKKLLRPFRKWKRHKNKNVKSFAKTYLKTIKSSPEIFVIHKSYVEKSGRITKLLAGCKKGNLQKCKAISTPFEFFQKYLSKQEKSFWADLNQIMCSLKSGEGCSNLGVMYGVGDHYKKDSSLSFSFYQKSCDYGFAGGCANLAWMYISGEGVPKDIKKGVSTAKKACTKGSGIGCAFVAQTIHLGKYGKNDPKMIKRYYQKGCYLKTANSCFALAQHVAKTEKGPQATFAMLKALSSACKFGISHACQMVYESVRLPKILKNKTTK